MAGLGSADKGARAPFLSVAGGFLWDRSVEDVDHPNFSKQEYKRADGTKGERQGAKYGYIEGMITEVIFRTHEKYGENINVRIVIDEETQYLVSSRTNNRYCSDIMKFLLKCDFDKEAYLKPYDFTGSDGNRATGISFRQDGKKIPLKCEESPKKSSEWFAEASKKDKKRFFEDVNDWFVQEVKDSILPQFSKEEGNVEVKAETKPKAKKEVKEEKKEVTGLGKKKKEVEEVKTVTVLQMKRFLKSFIAENYEDETLPKLSKEDVKIWYDLAEADEDLPFPKEEVEAKEESEDDLNAQLEALED